MMYRHSSIIKNIENADNAEDQALATAEALIAISKIMYNEMRASCLRR